MIIKIEKLTLELMKSDNNAKVQEEHSSLINKMHEDTQNAEETLTTMADDYVETTADNNVEVLNIPENASEKRHDKYDYVEEIEEEESLSIHDKELELIKKTLEKYKGKRKDAAEELGMSERTLYRKIKQYNL